jgi:hypothetical protein
MQIKKTNSREWHEISIFPRQEIGSLSTPLTHQSVQIKEPRKAYVDQADGLG